MARKPKETPAKAEEKPATATPSTLGELSEGVREATKVELASGTVREDF